MAAPRPWPSANAYSQAVQNPSTAFNEPLLRAASVARDRLGMPLVMSGNFAYVFKIDLPQGGSRAVKCFRRALGDREPRFVAIDAHLEQLALDDVAHFEYEPEGVRVEGAWYPTLVMEWVEGPTLDVYVSELLGGTGAPAALRELAEQWSQLVAKLEDSGIAHGDLQHGNVIVTPGGLRLVDLDGMYVPALQGRGSPGEVGHRHYQHPSRTVADFDAGLDRFASVVVHVSLLALAAEPALWNDFHDDNLLFERSDFLHPAQSELFVRLERQGGDVARLAAALRQACGRTLAEVPALTSLVTVTRSNLPLWIRQPVVPNVQKRTREAAPGEVVAPTPAPATPPTAPAPPRSPLSWAHPNPPSPPPPAPTVVARAPPRAPFGVPSPGPLPVGWPPRELSPLRVAAYVATVAGMIGFSCFGLWMRPVSSVVDSLGVRSGSRMSAVLGVALCVVVAAALGWGASRIVRRDGSLRLGRLPRLFRRRRASPWTGFVASTLLCVYHRPDCALVARIGIRNRVWLLHVYEAHAGGFQPCAVCRP